MAGLLDIEGVPTAYDKADVLEGVSLTIEPGRITCLLGSNGSGKTTLIRSILGLTPPRAGRIIFDGNDITALADPQGDRRRRRLHPGRPQSISEAHGRGEPAARRLSGTLGSRHPASAWRKSFACSRGWPSGGCQLAGTMSGGEQAMVSIGRGLMRAPKLLLIDEPSLGLSPLLVKENFNIIRKINERGISIFLVEQNVHQTLAISDYGYVLSKGRVVTEGKPERTRQDQRSPSSLFWLSHQLRLSEI